MKAISVWSGVASLALNTFGTLLFLGLSYLLYQAVTSSAIEVVPISVPKDLAERGYTSEAVTLQLREALLDTLKEARTGKSTATVVDQRNEPIIPLPQSGISLDTIAAEIRDHFGPGKLWRVSGGVESDGDQLTLNLSVDGGTEYKNVTITKTKLQINEFFPLASESIFELADPYIVAASYYEKNPGKSLELAMQIINSRPKNDSNVAWAHVLISQIQIDRHNSKAGENEANAAIQINNNIANAHVNLGSALYEEGNLSKAFDEYREAVWLDNRNAVAYYSLGLVLAKQGERRLAIDQYKMAVERDPGYSNAHNNLGLLLWDERARKEATEEYSEALADDPRNDHAHFNLGNSMLYQGKVDAAIKELSEAVAIEPSDPAYQDALRTAQDNKALRSAPSGTRPSVLVTASPRSP